MKKIFLIFLFFTNFSYAEVIKNYVKQNSNTQESKEKYLYPYVYFDFKTEFFYDNLNPEEGERQNLFYTKSELLIDLNLNKFLAFHTNFGLEQVKGLGFTPSSFNNFEKKQHAFYGTSLTAKELSAKFTFDRIQIYAGKFSAYFAGGSERWSDYFYDNWYGIGGTFTNEGYKIEEKLGLKLDALVVENDVAKITFQGSMFTNDNTTLFKKPFFVEREIGGFTIPFGEKRMAGSANGLKSRTISLQGFTGLSNRDILSFGAGYKYQASEEDIAEEGFSGTLQYTITFFDDLTLSAFGEAVKIRNAYSIENFSEKYLTGSVSAGFAGLKVGFVRNHYKGTLLDETNVLKFSEYFVGFEVPKTDLGIFLAKKEYDGNKNASGFGLNVRYRIK